VFLDFREVEDNIWHHYTHLEGYLEGRGVPNIDEALKEIFLKPLHQAFRELANEEMFALLYEKRFRKMSDKVDSNFLKKTTQKMQDLLPEIRNYSGGSGSLEAVSPLFNELFPIIFQLNFLDKKFKCPEARLAQSALKNVSTFFKGDKIRWYTLFSWMLVHHLGALVDPEESATQSRAGLDEWLLGKILEQNFYDLGISHEQVPRNMLAIKVLTSHQDWWVSGKKEKEKPVYILESFLRDSELRDFLQVNRYRDLLWFNKEAFDELLQWLLSTAVLDAIRQFGKDKKVLCQELEYRYKIIRKLQAAQKKSEYQIEKLLAALK